MYQLARAACLLAVLSAPLLVVQEPESLLALSSRLSPTQASPEASVALPDDPCAMARRIAARRPCVRAEDCGAFQEWKRVFGAPRIEPLQPELAGRGPARAAGRFGTAPPEREAPLSFRCPAIRGSR